MGVAGAVVVWASACDTVRIAGEATSPNAAAVSKESECVATTDLFRLRMFTHFQAPGLLPSKHDT